MRLGVLLLCAGCAFDLDAIGPPGGSDGPVADAAPADAAPTDAPVVDAASDGPRGRVHFGNARVLPTGSGSQGIVVAKLVGDSALDVAVADSASNQVVVLAQTGPLTFTPQTIPAGAMPVALASGNLDGDGRPDLAIVNQGDSTVQIALQTTAGQFSSQTMQVGQMARDVVVADVTGDQIGDVIVVNGGSNSVSVFLSLGNGSFQGRTDYTVQSMPVSAVAGGFDNTGRTSLAVSHASGNIVLLRASNVAGVFDSSGMLTVAAGIGRIARGPLAPNTLDDLVVTGPLDQISIVRQGAAGLFGSPTALPTATGPLDLRIADMDGDSVPDVVVLGQSTLTIFFGDATGAFTREDIPLEASPGRRLAIGDVSGDGRPDVAVTTSLGVSLYVQD